MKSRISLVIACTIFLSACVSPHYEKPLITISTHFKEARGWKRADPQDDVGKGEWWLVFNDPELNRLEMRLHNANQTIAASAAQYEAAQAMVLEAEASYFPTLALSSSMTRTKVSNFGGGAPVSASGVENTKNTFTNTKNLMFTASWVPDFWGNVRRTVNADVLTEESSKAQLANVKLIAETTLAQTYFELLAVDKGQQWLDDAVRAYQRSLSIAQHSYEAGITARADVLQAQSAVDNAQALALDNKITRAKYEHALAVLIGVVPAELSMHFKPLQLKRVAVPLFIPSQLLERRPDIAAAERTMAAANAEIGVAMNTYFPALTLTGSAGVQNKAFSQLFSIPSLGWALGPQLAATLLNGGLRSAQIKVAKANYAEAAANYKTTVLNAFQNVEDNLAAIRFLDNEIRLQKRAVLNARKALDILMHQYKAGIVNYTAVVTAQTAAYAVEKKEVDMESLRMTATIGLISALGGGWEKACSSYSLQ